MKMKHQKQHQKNVKSEVSFCTETDKFGNITVIAMLDGITVSSSHVAEHRIEKEQKALAQKLYCQVYK